MLAGDGLHPSAKGIRMRFSGSERAITDGPFAETREQLGGYVILKVESLDAARLALSMPPGPP